MDTNETNETNDSNDQIINNEEPIILPIPVSLSQLMGSYMNNMNNMIYTTNIVNTNIVTNQDLNINEQENTQNDNMDGTNIIPNDTNILPYENINQPNLFMNIFTRNRIIPQGPQQTFEEQLINQTFNQQNKYKKVCSKDFINSLSVQKVTKEMVEKKITCGICLDELNEDEDVLELPCKDKHYFHIKNEACDGIYPWLKENNTCPLCRYEFPSDEKEIQDQPTVEPIRPVLRPFNLMEIVNQALQDEEERILQQTILESLNDSNQENNNDSI